MINSASVTRVAGDCSMAPRRSSLRPTIEFNLLNKLHKETLREWIFDAMKLYEGQRVEFKLIYKGSRDGFSALSFHLKADDTGPTVTLIRSNDQVFGGFATASWTSSHYRWVRDERAFLFSLTHGRRYIQTNNTPDELDLGKSLYHHKDYLVAFGAGHDLLVASHCNQNRNSYCNIRTTFCTSLS